MLSLDKSLTQKDIEDLLNFFASDNNGNVDIDGSSFIFYLFFFSKNSPVCEKSNSALILGYVIIAPLQS